MSPACRRRLEISTKNPPRPRSASALASMAAMSAPVNAMTAGLTGGAVVVVGAVTMIGFDTLDEQPDDVLHGPVVIVAVFVMVPVALAETTALNVAVAVSPAARLTAKVNVLPLPPAVQVSGAVAAQAGAGVEASVSPAGRASVIVAVPAPSPTFLMATV